MKSAPSLSTTSTTAGPFGTVFGTTKVIAVSVHAVTFAFLPATKTLPALVPKSVPVRLADAATATEADWPGAMWGTAATAGTQGAKMGGKMRMGPNPFLVGEPTPCF